MFNVGQSIRKKYVHKANLHLFLRRPNALHSLNQAAIRIDVYERFANGTVRSLIHEFMVVLFVLGWREDCNQI